MPNFESPVSEVSCVDWWLLVAIVLVGFGLLLHLAPFAVTAPLISASVYPWSNVHDLEDSVASGRASAEVVAAVAGVSSLSMSARRDAGLAELMAMRVPVFNPRAGIFGAKFDGASDDFAAWTATIAAANAANGVVWHPGGTSTITAPLTFPQTKRTKIWGCGEGLCSLKAIAPAGGSNSGQLISVTHTHASSEWFCELKNVTLDGGGGAGPAASISRPSKFILKEVQITNCTGTGLTGLSWFDVYLENVFLSAMNGVVGTTAPAVLFDTVGAGTPGEHFDHNTIINLHVESGFASNGLELRGNATNLIRYNRWLDLKVHGNPATGDPAAILVLIGANVRDDQFVGAQIVASRGVAQVQVAGVRNLFQNWRSSITGGFPPTCFFEFLSGGNDNRVRYPVVDSASYTTAVFKVAAGALRNRVDDLDPSGFGFSAIVLMANSGTSSWMEGRKGCSADRGDAAVSVTHGLDFETQRFDSVLTADRNFTVPNAAALSNTTGAKFRVVRTGGGAFNVVVRDSTPTVIKNVATGQWVDIEFNDGSGWKAVAFGSL